MTGAESHFTIVSLPPELLAFLSTESFNLDNLSLLLAFNLKSRLILLSVAAYRAVFARAVMQTSLGEDAYAGGSLMASRCFDFRFRFSRSPMLLFTYASNNFSICLLPLFSAIVYGDWPGKRKENNDETGICFKVTRV